MTTQEKSKFQSLSELLEELNERGNFGASAIASEDGLVMAEHIRNNLSREALAAVSALVYAMGQRTQDYLKLKKIYGIGFDSPLGRIYFRPIVIREDKRKTNLILTVIGNNSIPSFKERLNILLFKRSLVETLLDWAKQSIIKIFNEPTI
jgi:predicted regulator of Ras-like GTPase activity (Roadblock/LC7/MglB family)